MYEGTLDAMNLTNTVVVLVASRSGKGAYFDAEGVVLPPQP